MTSGGFSAKRLTRVRDVLSRHLDDGYVPGAVAVVARHGEVGRSKRPVPAKRPITLRDLLTDAGAEGRFRVPAGVL